MSISASPRACATTTPADALAPLRFPPGLRLTPEQFALLCAENREAVLELAADGQVLAMTPTGSETGARNTRLEMRLLLWADQHGGWKVFGSSTGFRLPDGAVLSPDASLVRRDRWQALTPEQRRFTPENGCLQAQWCSSWLAAAARAAGCGGVARISGSAVGSR